MTRPSQQYRMDIAAEREAFDWDAWNREFAEGLAALERLNQIEAEQAQARLNMSRNLRAMIEGITQ